jgi:hypothetical protein
VLICFLRVGLLCRHADTPKAEWRAGRPTQATLIVLSLLLQRKQRLVMGVLPVHPRHAALDLFSVYVQAARVYSANNSPIPVTVLLLDPDLLTKDQIG